MNEYMIRFDDGVIKHIKADACVFTNKSGVPMVDFYKNDKLHYSINLACISAIRFPEDGHESDSSDGDT